MFDLPWLDFAWFFPTRPHKLRTPPWSKLHPSLLAAGGSVRWEDKIELAMHTGNVGPATGNRHPHGEALFLTNLFFSRRSSFAAGG